MQLELADWHPPADALDHSALPDLRPAHALGDDSLLSPALPLRLHLALRVLLI
jgi:hypothetical protein